MNCCTVLAFPAGPASPAGPDCVFPALSAPALSVVPRMVRLCSSPAAPGTWSWPPASTLQAPRLLSSRQSFSATRPTRHLAIVKEGPPLRLCEHLAHSHYVAPNAHLCAEC